MTNIGAILSTFELDAINKAGNPRVPLTLESYVPVYFQVVASLIVDPGYIPENVLADVEERLRYTFSFEKRKHKNSCGR